MMTRYQFWRDQDPLQRIIWALHDELNASSSEEIGVYGIVPKQRPQQFVTVERTGGRITRFLDYGQYAIQAWADNVFNVVNLSGAVNAAILSLTDLPWCAGAEIGSTYNFPDPESRQYRWQTTATITTTSGNQIIDKP